MYIIILVTYGHTNIKLKNLLSLIIYSFVTIFKRFLACNLDYWFLDTSHFVYFGISHGDYGCSLFSDHSFIIGESFFYHH